MSRSAVLVVCLVCSAPALAQQAAGAGAEARAAGIDPALLKAQADALLQETADHSVSDVRLHGEAAAMFTEVQSQTPVIRPTFHPVEREHVDGHTGTLDGMIDTAQQRLADYRRTHREPPPPEVLSAMEKAAELRDSGRADFDHKGQLNENQMGVFQYNTESRDGLVRLNTLMALFAARIGEAFAYATLAHEATHALAREQARLDPQHAVDGEIEAFRAQFLWLTVMDPTGMRLAVLETSLMTYLKLHPLAKDAPIVARAVTYLDHLNQLWFTGGKEDKLRDFVKNLGYEDDDAPKTPPAPAPAEKPVRA